MFVKSIKGLLLLALSIHVSLSANWVEGFRKKIAQNERPEWMLKRIHKDLDQFKDGITKASLDNVAKLSRLARYQIRNGEVYCNGGIAKDYIGNAIRTINSIAPLPPLDFVLSRNDSFYHDARLIGCKGPLFSFAKRAGDEGIILIPDTPAIIGYDANYAEVMKGRALYPWHKKVNKVFWRGANSGFLPGSLAFMNPSNYLKYPRCKLVKLSLDNPTYIDARFNFLPHIDDDTRKFLTKIGFTGNTVSITEHLKYKYQVLIDGYTCAFHRAWWQLFSDCVTFKQESPDFQWYYDELIPHVHYIPVENDLSDLISKLDWAKAHDEDLKRIVINANTFAHTHLKHEDIMLYVYLLLSEYAKLMK